MKAPKLLLPLLTLLILTSCNTTSPAQTPAPQSPLTEDSLSPVLPQPETDEKTKALLSTLPPDAQIYSGDFTGDGIDDCAAVWTIEDSIASHREEIHIFDGANEAEYTVDPRKIYKAVDAVTYMYYNNEENCFKAAVYYPAYSPETEPTVAAIPASALESVNNGSLLDETGCSCSYTVEDDGIHVIFPVCWGLAEKIGELDAPLTFDDGQFKMKTVSFRSAAPQTLAEAEQRIKKRPFEEGDFTYRYYKTGLLAAEYHGEGGDVVIPEEVSGLPVIAVGINCFGTKTDVTSVTANSILEIGWGAFSGMDSLTSFTAPKLVEVGLNAFSFSENLEHVEIPNAVLIGAGAFDTCEKLKEIDLPNARVIGGEAFRYTSLEKISLPSAKFIGSGVFMECYSLRKAYIPALENMEDGMFYLCGDVTVYTDAGNTTVTDYYNAGKWGKFVTGLEYTADEAVTYVNYGALFGDDDDYLPVYYSKSGTNLLTGSAVYSNLSAALDTAPAPDTLTSDGRNLYPDLTHETYTAEKQPDNPAWGEYFTTRLPDCGDIFFRESQTFSVGGREMALVTAGNVGSGQGSIVPDGNYPPILYAMTALFVDGVPHELYFQSDEIPPESLSFEPKEGFMQEYEAYQVGGEPVPIYNNMSGGYIVRDYQYLPAAVVCDIDGDSTAELVLCVKKASSVMCWCEVYELDGEVPEKTLHAAVN